MNYQHSSNLFKLHLGCGPDNLIKGWVNSDIFPVDGAVHLDFTKPFEFPENTVDAVFCEHCIEHVEKFKVWGILRQIYRVLKPGAPIRLVTPSLDNFCKLVLDPDSEDAQKYLQFHRHYSGDRIATVADTLNMMIQGHGHLHIYSSHELIWMLKEVGFKNVVTPGPDKYRYEIFIGCDGHSRTIGSDINQIESLAVEAEK